MLFHEQDIYEKLGLAISQGPFGNGTEHMENTMREHDCDPVFRHQDV